MAKCAANTQGGSVWAPKCTDIATCYIVIYGSKIKYCDAHGEKYGRFGGGLQQLPTSNPQKV